MMAPPGISGELPVATAGIIAAINLNSSLRRSWRSLELWPNKPGTADRIVDEEQYRVQFYGDVTALDRLVALEYRISSEALKSADICLIAARIASTVHRFSEATNYIRNAEALGASDVLCEQLALSIDQAIGRNLDNVLALRQRIARTNQSIQNLVSLGALLADLGEFDDADRAYRKAIQNYRDVSPFALAGVCFRLGLLWGETAFPRQSDQAAHWYTRAISYFPNYSHARVHLAELHLSAGRLDEAQALLDPIAASNDPEVAWRLAEIHSAKDDAEAATRHLEAARIAFNDAIHRHELAFADHGAEFYLSAGSDFARARNLASINLANRPTLRAFELAYAAAKACEDENYCARLRSEAEANWKHIKAYRTSVFGSGGT